MAKILDGKALSKTIIATIKEKTTSLLNTHNVRPGLAVILIGEDSASQIYVRAKAKTAKECLFYSLQHNLPSSTSQEELCNLIEEFNQDPHIHGILVQLPLPDHIDKTAIMQAISPEKDVDGFHYNNVAKLATGNFEDAFLPCTPAGIMVMLKHYIRNDFSGLDAVVVGRSNIVGRPMAQLLLHEDATVTITHHKTQQLDEVCRSADILVSATGQPYLIKGEWIKPGAIVIDVGISRLPHNGGYKIVGDVAFEEAQHIAGYISPVPGGVGPMTIAMLMANTLNSACSHSKTSKLSLFNKLVLP